MLELRDIQDIIVPFERLGDEGWDKTTRELLADQAEMWGSPMNRPVAETLIQTTEKRLGAALPEDLKLFYRTFGVADIGEELQALENMDILAVWAEGLDLDDMLDPDQAALLPRLVTFSEYLGNGNAFCFHKDSGAVYYFDHDTAPHLVRLFDSPGDYLKGCLIKLQEAFFIGDNGEECVEDKLVELFGEGVVTKWLY